MQVTKSGKYLSLPKAPSRCRTPDPNRDQISSTVLEAHTIERSLRDICGDFMKEAWIQLSGACQISLMVALFLSKAAFATKEPLKIRAQFQVQVIAPQKTKTFFNRIQITLLSLVILLSQPNQSADLNNLLELQKHKLVLRMLELQLIR